MKKRAFRRQLGSVLTAIAFGTLGCSAPDTSARNRAIEGALNQAFQLLEIPTGHDLRTTGDILAQLKSAESAGLVELRHPSWMEVGVFEVVATPKLIGIALNPDDVWTQQDSEFFLGGEPETSNERFERFQRARARVSIRQAKLDKVLVDEEYKGPLAAPGEEHRLVLGTFRSAPSSAAAVVGPGLATPEESVLRFRCVAKYSEFKKEWSVVAFDVGSIDPERWFTSKVM